MLRVAGKPKSLTQVNNLCEESGDFIRDTIQGRTEKSVTYLFPSTPTHLPPFFTQREDLKFLRTSPKKRGLTPEKESNLI